MKRAFVLGLSIAVFIGCGGDDGPSLRDDVSGVATTDAAATVRFVAGAPPQHGTGPEVQVVTNTAVIPGGTAPVTLSAGEPFSVAIVAIDGLGGYFRIELPAPALAVELLVTLSQELAETDFVWIFGIGSDAAFGYASAPVTVVPVGTGDVQVSLSWSSQADVDLHVVDPGGEEIYYGNRSSSSGGELDLDSNAGCGSDGPRNENITWPVQGAPDGSYRVLVDYWSSCGVPATDFVVTVNVRDTEPQTFSGSFTGTGDTGDAGAGEPITTFTSGPGARGGGTRVLGTFEIAQGAVVHVK